MQYIECVISKEEFKEKYKNLKFLNVSKAIHRSKLLIDSKNKWRGFIKFKEYGGVKLDQDYYLIINKGMELVDGSNVTGEFEKEYFINKGSIVKKDFV